MYEVMFSWTKPNPHNHLSFFSRFSELKLSEYINEFELMTKLYNEKSVNIDCQRYVLRLTSESVRIFYIIMDIIRRQSNYQLMGNYNTS